MSKTDDATTWSPFFQLISPSFGGESRNERYEIKGDLNNGHSYFDFTVVLDSFLKSAPFKKPGQLL